MIAQSANQQVGYRCHGPAPWFPTKLQRKRPDVGILSLCSPRRYREIFAQAKALEWTQVISIANLRERDAI
jgi:hypothetical protein